MWRLAAIGLLEFGCSAAEVATVQVDATLETGSQAGTKIPVTLAYDASAVAPKGDCVIPASPVGEQVTALQRAEAMFHDGVPTGIRMFLRLEGADSPIHNLVIGVGGPGTLGYVDQTGGIGTGTYRLRTVPNNGNLSVIRPLPAPLELHQHLPPAPHPPPPGLPIFGPDTAAPNPLNPVH